MRRRPMTRPLAVERDADLLEAEPVGVGTAADRDEHDIGLELGLVAARGRLERQRDAVLAALGAGHLGAELELEALIACSTRCNTLPVSRSMFGRMRSRNSTTVTLAPSRAPDRAQLEPDIAAADHDELLRHLGRATARRSRRRCASRRSSTPGSGDAFRAGGDDDRRRPRSPAPRRPRRRTATLPGAAMRAGALEPVDLVLAEQELDAAWSGRRPPCPCAPSSPAGRARRRRRLTPCAAKRVRRLLEFLRGLQQRLRRDAADIEAGAAERSRGFSTQAVFMPSCAARIAAT